MHSKLPIPSNNGDCNMLMDEQKSRRVAVKRIQSSKSSRLTLHLSLSLSAQGLHNPPLLFVSEYSRSEFEEFGPVFPNVDAHSEFFFASLFYRTCTRFPGTQVRRQRGFRSKVETRINSELTRLYPVYVYVYKTFEVET